MLLQANSRSYTNISCRVYNISSVLDQEITTHEIYHLYARFALIFIKTAIVPDCTFFHVITRTLVDASEILPLLSPAHHSSSSRSKWIDLLASPRIYKQLGYEKLLRPLIKSASGQEKLSSSHTLAGVNGLKEKERDRGLNRALLDRFPIKNHKK